MQTIKAIYGQEPIRQGEYPSAAIVGADGVTRIVSRDEHWGDHGLCWFDVYKGEQRVRSINARHIAEIFYYMESEL